QKELTYGEAINEALRRCLEDDPRALLYGEDTAKPGGVFGVTRRLHREFGDRVFDTPISESAILGSAIGAALVGMRPIVEIMWLDFAMVAFDQLVNQAANVRYVSQGDLTAPITVRTQQGYLPGSCAQHAQNLEAMVAHIPGLRVCVPVSAQDAHDCVLAGHYCDDPVVIIENRGLYRGAKEAVEVKGPVRPIGGSRTLSSGDDITLVSWGPIIREVTAAAGLLDEAGIGATVIEMVWLNPLDMSPILESVSRTGRVLVVHEANVTGGLGAEISARVAESGVAVRSPVRRLGLPDVPVPAAPHLMGALLPNAAAIADAAAATMEVPDVGNEVAG
ncbi:MAG: hypothetical protein OXD30_08010, partial [Bryobacterales bacterium]|nr:hypothetical protein [Bryobacterales bacterium]